MSQFKPPQPDILTLEKFKQIVPALSDAEARELIGPLNDTMRRGNISGKNRVAAFLSQTAVESDYFTTTSEYDSGARYEGRADLGNTQPGDGVRYKGRGYIQLTGRGNYAAAGQALGVGDLFVRNPEIVATPQYAFAVSEWYWTEHGINALADAGNINDISAAVNYPAAIGDPSSYGIIRGLDKRIAI